VVTITWDNLRLLGAVCYRAKKKRRLRLEWSAADYYYRSRCAQKNVQGKKMPHYRNRSISIWWEKEVPIASSPHASTSKGRAMPKCSQYSSTRWRFSSPPSSPPSSNDAHWRFWILYSVPHPLLFSHSITKESTTRKRAFCLFYWSQPQLNIAHLIANNQNLCSHSIETSSRIDNK
jgi:hypothetical protein